MLKTAWQRMRPALKGYQKLSGLTRAIFVGGAVLAGFAILEPDTTVQEPIGVHVFEDGSVYVDQSEEAQKARSDQWIEDCANPKNSTC